MVDHTVVLNLNCAGFISPHSSSNLLSSFLVPLSLLSFAGFLFEFAFEDFLSLLFVLALAFTNTDRNHLPTWLVLNLDSGFNFIAILTSGAGTFGCPDV